MNSFFEALLYNDSGRLEQEGESDILKYNLLHVLYTGLLYSVFLFGK